MLLSKRFQKLYGRGPLCELFMLPIYHAASCSVLQEVLFALAFSWSVSPVSSVRWHCQEWFLTFPVVLPVGLLQKKSQEGTQTTMEATLMAQQTPVQREQVYHAMPCITCTCTTAGYLQCACYNSWEQYRHDCLIALIAHICVWPQQSCRQVCMKALSFTACMRSLCPHVVCCNIPSACKHFQWMQGMHFMQVLLCMDMPSCVTCLPPPAVIGTSSLLLQSKPLLWLSCIPFLWLACDHFCDGMYPRVMHGWSRQICKACAHNQVMHPTTLYHHDYNDQGESLYVSILTTMVIMTRIYRYMCS